MQGKPYADQVSQTDIEELRRCRDRELHEYQKLQELKLHELQELQELQELRELRFKELNELNELHQLRKQRDLLEQEIPKYFSPPNHRYMHDEFEPRDPRDLRDARPDGRDEYPERN